MRNKKTESQERCRRQRLSRAKKSDNPQEWVDRLAYDHEGDRVCSECGHLFSLWDDISCPRCNPD
jgi:rubrerythrin